MARKTRRRSRRSRPPPGRKGPLPTMGRAQAPGGGAPVASIARVLSLASCRLIFDGPDTGTPQSGQIRGGARCPLSNTRRAATPRLLLWEEEEDEHGAEGADRRQSHIGHGQVQVGDRRHQDQRGKDEPRMPWTDRAALRPGACRHGWFGQAASAGATPPVSKAPNGPPDPGDQRQDAKCGDQTAIGQPEHQQEPHDSGDRGVFVLDRQLNFLLARFVARDPGD
jgi:hypothetical protein